MYIINHLFKLSEQDSHWVYSNSLIISSATEAFSYLVMKVKEEDFLSGFKVGCSGKGGIKITCLLYANNTTNFCETSQIQLMHLNYTLMWFNMISCLKSQHG